MAEIVDRSRATKALAAAAEIYGFTLDGAQADRNTTGYAVRFVKGRVSTVVIFTEETIKHLDNFMRVMEGEK